MSYELGVRLCYVGLSGEVSHELLSVVSRWVE